MNYLFVVICKCFLFTVALTKVWFLEYGVLFRMAFKLLLVVGVFDCNLYN